MNRQSFKIYDIVLTSFFVFIINVCAFGIHVHSEERTERVREMFNLKYFKGRNRFLKAK